MSHSGTIVVRVSVPTLNLKEKLKFLSSLKVARVVELISRYELELFPLDTMDLCRVFFYDGKYYLHFVIWKGYFLINNKISATSVMYVNL